MPNMKTTIDALKEAGVRVMYRVMVGGAPLLISMQKKSAQMEYASDASRRLYWQNHWRHKQPKIGRILLK